MRSRKHHSQRCVPYVRFWPRRSEHACTSSLKPANMSIPQALLLTVALATLVRPSLMTPHPMHARADRRQCATILLGFRNLIRPPDEVLEQHQQGEDGSKSRSVARVVVLLVGYQGAACCSPCVEQHVLARRHGSRGCSDPCVGKHLELQRGMSGVGLTAHSAAASTLK